MIWLVSGAALLISSYTLYRITLIGSEIEGVVSDVSTALDEINQALIEMGEEDEE